MHYRYHCTAPAQHITARHVFKTENTLRSKEQCTTYDRKHVPNVLSLTIQRSSTRGQRGQGPSTFSTGWQITLVQTSRWHQNIGCVLVHGPHTKTELLFGCQREVWTSVMCHPVNTTLFPPHTFSKSCIQEQRNFSNSSTVSSYLASMKERRRPLTTLAKVKYGGGAGRGNCIWLRLPLNLPHPLCMLFNLLYIKSSWSHKIEILERHPALLHKSKKAKKFKAW